MLSYFRPNKGVATKYLISGYSKSSNGDLSINKGLKDFWVCFINPDGTLISSDNYGGTGDDLARDAYFNTVDNAFYILGDCGSVDGDFPNPSSGLVHDRLFKFSTTGVFGWRRDFYTDRPFGVACSFVKLPNESGNFISGLLANQTGTNLFTVDYIGYTITGFFCKLNSSDGSTAWAKQPLNIFQASSASISITEKLPDGNILCTTRSNNNRFGYSRVFTINSNGVEIKTNFSHPCPTNGNSNYPSTYCYPPYLPATSGVSPKFRGNSPRKRFN